jgi:DNA polymerase elongation subunit (family B)
MALAAHQAGDGTPHSGAALHLFAAGVAHRIVKADVASLYPSLMRAYRIGPSRDHLVFLLTLVYRLLDLRLAAKARALDARPESAERYSHEAMSAAMKLVVNSAYGYLAAGGLTRFGDVDAANEVTRRGRETLELMCRELAQRGVTLLEADTDGVYFAVPEGWAEVDERRVEAEVAALLPPRVQLEFEGRYAAMLSHEPELPYEAMLAGGRTLWSVGDRVRVYRKRNGGCGLLEESDDGRIDVSYIDPRDYDVDYYTRQLRQTFASLLASAFVPVDYQAVFADPDQMSLFTPAVNTIRLSSKRKPGPRAG